MTTLTERVQMTGFWDLVARRTGAAYCCFCLLASPT